MANLFHLFKTLTFCFKDEKSASFCIGDGADSVPFGTKTTSASTANVIDMMSLVNNRYLRVQDIFDKVNCSLEAGLNERSS